jgi:hypothetical protein
MIYKPDTGDCKINFSHGSRCSRRNVCDLCTVIDEGYPSAFKTLKSAELIESAPEEHRSSTGN